VTSFQSAAGAQGRQFAQQCDFLLQQGGFELGKAVLLRDVGVEIDREAVSPSGRTVWFEYKGSIQGVRPGLIRTDTLKKAIANGALLTALPGHPPYIVLTSHLPTSGAALAMLAAAQGLGYFDDVVCIYDPVQAARLRDL
jgi:hypothetical protein